MPQPVGGFSPNQNIIQDQGYKMPQHFGRCDSYNTNFSNNYTDDDVESEYEYITDDEGDFVEDENGAIYTLEEAQKRGLLEPATGERGIGKKLLLGTVLLGGTWMLRKQIKKKKRVKKQNHNNNQTQTTQTVKINNTNNINNNTNNTNNKYNNNNNNSNNNDVNNRQNIYPFLRNNTQNANNQSQYSEKSQYPNVPQYPSQTPNVYGQNNYGPPPSYQQNAPYGTPLYPNYNSYNGYNGYCYNNNNNIPTW
jgi:hypothetical protein